MDNIDPSASPHSPIDCNERINNEFAALLNAAVDAILEINAEGELIRWNDAASRLFGYELSEVIGKNISQLMPEPDRSRHDSYISRYLGGGEPHIIGIGREVRAQRKDGSVFPIHLSVGEIKTDAEIRFVGIIRDLTDQQERERELKQAEEEAREYREKLAHVDRVSTMGEMASGLAHELNQPLTAITSYAQGCRNLLSIIPNLTQKDDSGADILCALNNIESEARRASEIIQRIRGFVKAKESKHEVCDCNALIQEVMKFTEIKSLSENMQFKLDLSDDLAVFVGDPIQIQQVILNLTRNAVESTLERPIHDSDAKIITIRSRSEGEGQIKISVIDNGVGLPEGAEHEIFAPFYTTKESGMGMGLSICDSIIRAHGGVLKAEPNTELNSGNKGMIFSFTLPTALTPTN